MSGLTLQLLGPPSASVSRAPPGPGMGAAKNLALLAYLALEPGSHSRESLAALLWGESPEQAARASLRQALRRLRAAVGDDLRSSTVPWSATSRRFSLRRTSTPSAP